MQLSDKLQEAVEGNKKPYIAELAYNISQALPDATIKYDLVNIYTYLYGEQQSDLKQWLYGVLETLPDINHPIERVSFVIYVDDKIEKVVVINPTENDVRAIEYAIETGLKFSKPTTPYSDEPLPLDHPYYSDKKHFVPKKFKWVDGKQVYEN